MFNTEWEEKLLSNVKKNSKWILEKNYDNNLTAMANELNIKVNTLYTYLNTDTKPPLTFVAKLCSSSDITLDSIIYEDFELMGEKSKKKELLKQVFNRFEGTYYAYFFVVDSNSLKEGLIQEAEIKISGSGNVVFEILQSNKQFTGNLIVTDELTFLDMKTAKEKISVTLKSPGKSIRERFLGGIGIINISSPEDNRIPNAQKIVISRYRMAIDKYFTVLREFMSVRTYFKIRKKLLSELLINNIKISQDKYEVLKSLLEDKRISEEDKVVIGTEELNQFYEVLDRNEFLEFRKIITKTENSKDIINFNSIKVSLNEDKMLYRFIKNEFEL